MSDQTNPADQSAAPSLVEGVLEKAVEMILPGQAEFTALLDQGKAILLREVQVAIQSAEDKITALYASKFHKP